MTEEVCRNMFFKIKTVVVVLTCRLLSRNQTDSKILSGEQPIKQYGPRIKAETTYKHKNINDYTTTLKKIGIKSLQSLLFIYYCLYIYIYLLLAV